MGAEVLMGIQFASGQKVTVVNVLHVHNIKKNIVCVNLPCKSRIMVVLESNKLILSKNGICWQRMFSDEMLKLSINDMTKVFAYMVNCSLILWHECSRHVNFGSLKFSSKRGLIKRDNHKAK